MKDPKDPNRSKGFNIKQTKSQEIQNTWRLLVIKRNYCVTRVNNLTELVLLCSYNGFKLLV